MTTADNSMLTEIKVEVAMLKQEVSFINKLFDRMEVLIEKVDTQYETLVDKTSKIESNLSYTKEELTELYDLLTQTEKEIHQKIEAVEKALIKDIDDSNTKIDKLQEETGDLSQSKWMMLGGSGVILWLLSHTDLAKKFLP